MIEVFVTGMLMRWMRGRHRPMAMGAKPDGALLDVAPMMMNRKTAVRATSTGGPTPSRKSRRQRFGREGANRGIREVEGGDGEEKTGSGHATDELRDDVARARFSQPKRPPVACPWVMAGLRWQPEM